MGQCFGTNITCLVFSGYLGYLILAHYIRVHLTWSAHRRLAVGIPLTIAGAVATILSFYVQAEPGVTLVTPELEIGWAFCTVNVVALTAGMFLIFTAIPQHEVPASVVEVSNLTYGMFLMHIFWLYLWVIVFKNTLALPTVAAIPVIAVATFVSSLFASKILSMIPGGGWLLGTAAPRKK